MIIRAYKYLYYIIYKCIQCTTKKQLQNEVPSSANALYFSCLNYNFITVLILTRLLAYLPSNSIYLLVVYLIFTIVWYYFNKKLFLKNDKYKEIIHYYDLTNKLSNIHFCLITALYVIGTLSMLVLSGINYTS